MTTRTARPAASAAPARRARNEAERQARERAILDAALAVFSDRGFAAARLEDVAARAGVAKGTIYLYFPSKQALFEALIRTGIAGPIEAARTEMLDLDLPLEAVLRGLFTRLRTEILGTPRREIVRLVLTEAGRFPQIAAFYHREVVSRGMGLLRTIGARALERGEIRSDAIIRFPQLVIAPGIVAFLWTSFFQRIEPLDAEAMFETHLALLMRALKAPEP